MKTWISGDHHFGHANIIKYTNRPYKNVNEMDDELISLWNGCVAPEDIVYYLGDFTLGDSNYAGRYFSLLNGTIFVLGYAFHHDKRWMSGAGIPGISIYDSRSKVPVRIELPIFVLENVDIDLDGNDIPTILCHYAFEVWDRKHYGSLHFHGHSHGMLPKIRNRLDVGVDNAYKLMGEYRPLSLEECIKFAKDTNV
jgi:calcineurin-like phosphoesterase family protein